MAHEYKHAMVCPICHQKFKIKSVYFAHLGKCNGGSKRGKR